MNTRISRRARRELVKGLVALGLPGRSVLDVGCGPGGLTRKLLRAGASRATGIDLAEKALHEARTTTQAAGLSDRVDYRIGNGATADLELHDIVVLDKVICCYPNWKELVDNTSSAAGTAYGFVIPRSQGLSAFVVRAFIAIQRFVLKLKKCGFVPFVHDYDSIHRHLSSMGFERKHLSLGPIWMTAVYARR